MAKSVTVAKPNVRGVDRLPWHRAHLYYDPNFLATPEDWASSLTALISRLLDDQSINGKIAEGFGIEWYGSIKFDELLLSIDALDGSLSVSEAAEEDFAVPSWLGVSGPIAGLCASVRTFPALLQTAPPPNRFESEYRSIVLPFAELLCRQITRRFEHALHCGQAQLEAKFHSFASSFSRIEPDELRFCRFKGKSRDLGEDSEFDEGVGENGELIYSFSVVPGQSPAPQAVAAIAGQLIHRTAETTARGSVAVISKPLTSRTARSGGDSRKKKRWEEEIRPITETLYKRMRLNPKRTATGLRTALQDEMRASGIPNDRIPGNTTYDDWFRNEYPDFLK